MTAIASATAAHAKPVVKADLRLRTRSALVVALGLSLAFHFAFMLWPEPLPENPDSAPLTASLTEMPPPPAPVAVAVPKAMHRMRRAVAPTIAEAVPTEMAVPADETVDAHGADAATAQAPGTADVPTIAASEPEIIPGAKVDSPTLPPRVDLAYKVFYGTRGFMIGEATYRFEHTGNNYRITTVGEARGLAALIMRGQGKVQSRGLITATGLQPLEFDVERGGPEHRESAIFDWEAGIVTMKDNQTAALDLPTFDPMTVMWQFYFSPPTQDVIAFSLATPRKFARYTVTREGSESIEWAQGTLDTERWHRRSEDGKTDAFVWLAPKLHYVPVKIRVTNTDRGTVEALLDAIRVDETNAESADPTDIGKVSKYQ
jgi:Protein of unknown function (DUF3108)